MPQHPLCSVSLASMVPGRACGGLTGVRVLLLLHPHVYKVTE